ncbi:MAG: glycosyltransferase [Eubacteriales bacterium]|nr:glycosyltransferase [Eubacteriales bacterium]
MAKLLFVMRYPLDFHDNLKGKFDGQMAAARALGHEAFYLGWNRQGIWLCGQGEPTLLKRCPWSGMPAYSHTLLFVDLMDALTAAVTKQRFALVYLRFMQLFGNAPKAFKAVKQSGAKLVVEHPTYPFENGKTTSLLRKPVFWYTDRVFRSITPMIDLFTLIGDPCGPTLNGRPAMNIVNGVDAEHFPLHRPRPEDEQVHMLALASMSRWQGYDRLLKAMAASPQNMVLHMAGCEGDGALAEWKMLAKELGVDRQVVWEGETYGEKLNELVARCDIGVGGLGLFRKGQFCSMTLKLREYMARGLPFVYAVDDPDLPEEPRFCLRIPNDDSLPDLEAIMAFARRAKTDRAVPEDMRSYAKSNMSWTGVMKPVLERVGVPCQKQ